MDFKLGRSVDEMRTSVVKALRALGEGANPESVEETLQLLLTEAYQAGQIEANNKAIARNAEILRRAKR